MYHKAMYRINGSARAFPGFCLEDTAEYAPGEEKRSIPPIFAKKVVFQIFDHLYPDSRVVCDASVIGEDERVVWPCELTILCVNAGVAMRLIPIYSNPYPDVEFAYDLSEHFDWEEVEDRELNSLASAD